MNNSKAIPKYSIVVITYNQEDLIGRALESIICQMEFVYEVIVSDDCSTDSTWEVINKYGKKYPDLIKPTRNPKNFGIFAHIEATWPKINGDITFYLSGDDELCDGLFKKANKLIEENSIDYKNDSFTLYFDYKQITPNGREILFSNSKITKFNPISLKIRNLISNRTTGFSRRVLDKFTPVNKEIGIYADGLIDIQTQLFSEKNYYYPFVGSIYYSGIGISSIIEKRESYNSYRMYMQTLLRTLDHPSRSDVCWIQYMEYKLSFLIDQRFKIFVKCMYYYLASFKLKYGITFAFRELKSIIKLSILVVKKI